MAKPIILVFLLLMIIFTSRFEWKQHGVEEVEARPGISSEQKHGLEREESVKEKIILSQEKNIQKLKAIVHSLKEQLQKCRSNGEATLNDTQVPLIDVLNDIEQKQQIDE